MKRPGALEGIASLTPTEQSYLDRFNRKSPVVCEGAAANRAGESVTFLSRLSLQTPELVDSADPGAMAELAARIVSHIPLALKGQQDQILNFCAAALTGATKTEDLVDNLGLSSEDIKTLRYQAKRVLRKALEVELYWAMGEDWQIFRRLHHEAIDRKDQNPQTW